MLSHSLIASIRPSSHKPNLNQLVQPVDLLYVLEYSVSLDEEGICWTTFELIFAFDEVISLGHKENVTVAQVKQYCEIESHEEKLHKLVMQSKINETKDVMKHKASEIDKKQGTLIENNRGAKGGFMSSMGSSRIESGFSEMNISSSGSGFRSGTSLGLSTDFDSFSTKPKGFYLFFLESLKAEGEVILEDIQPRASQSRATAAPLTDPATLNGRVSNFDVQGTLPLQIRNQDDGHIQVQIEIGENPGVLFKTHPNMNKELFSNENILGGDGVGLLKWRVQSTNESMVPLTSGNETYVSIEYEASSMFYLQNVVISVLLPALREAPNVKQVDGEWSGSMEFVVPPADSSMFSLFLCASLLLTHLVVVNLLPQGEAPPKFSQRTQLIIENYQVV
ncbi:hypothetical protein UlMin_000860 [Ulmus minor]